MSMRLREPGIEASISGAILFDETLRQEALSSEPLVALMQRAGILLGIKVDTGAKALASAAGETVSLAIERGPISVETLLEELWPGAEPVAATRALRMMVHRLRKALDDADVFRAVSGGYRLSENVAVDVLEAEHAVAAIGRLPSLVDRDRHRLETVFAEFIAPRPVVRTQSKGSRVRETAIADVRHRVGLLFGEDALQLLLSRRWNCWCAG